MNVIDAAYHTVHDYPGGAQSLAPRIGKTGKVLSAEVALNPALDSTAKLGLKTAIAIQQMTGDHRILFAMASTLGYVTLPMPQLDDSAGEDVRCVGQKLAGLAREFADVLGESSAAIADGKVTNNELAGVQKQCGELVAGVQALLRALGSLNADLRGEG